MWLLHAIIELVRFSIHSGIPIVIWTLYSPQVASDISNTYRFYCQVVEVIHKDGSGLIKTICNPGSLIIEIPNDGKALLGDKLIVTGKLQIKTTESNKSIEQ